MSGYVFIVTSFFEGGVAVCYGYLISRGQGCYSVFYSAYVGQPSLQKFMWLKMLRMSLLRNPDLGLSFF